MFQFRLKWWRWVFIEAFTLFVVSVLCCLIITFPPRGSRKFIEPHHVTLISFMSIHSFGGSKRTKINIVTLLYPPSLILTTAMRRICAAKQLQVYFRSFGGSWSHLAGRLASVQHRWNSTNHGCEGDRPESKWQNRECNIWKITQEKWFLNSDIVWRQRNRMLMLKMDLNLENKIK